MEGRLVVIDSCAHIPMDEKGKVSHLGRRHQSEEGVRGERKGRGLHTPCWMVEQALETIYPGCVTFPFRRTGRTHAASFSLFEKCSVHCPVKGAMKASREET